MFKEILKDEFISKLKIKFPNIKNDNYIILCDYEEFISLICDEIKIYTEFGMYSGDILTILSKENKLGFLSLSYGSCTFCDELQACHNFDALYLLYLKLNGNIRWFEDKNKLKEYVRNIDIKLEPFCNIEENEYNNFISKIEKI